MCRSKWKKYGCVAMIAMVTTVGACSAPPAMDAGMDVPIIDDTFRPLGDTFRPLVDTFVSRTDTFVAPVDDTFVLPDDTFVPDTDVPNVDVANPDVPDLDVPNFDVPSPQRDVPPGVDVPSDVRPAPGCGLMVEPVALAVPAAGMTTTVMTSLNAMGVGGMNAATSCRPGTGGSERIFRLTLAAETTIVLRANAMDANTDTVLAIRGNCASSASEAACDDDSGPATNSLIRRTLPAGEYFVLLDEFGPAALATGGMVTLTLQTVTLAANATCAGALPLMPGVVVNGNTNLTGADVAPNMCLGFNNGPELYYSFQIPALTSATFTAIPSGMPAWTPFVRVFNSCASQDVCTGTGAFSAMVRNGTMNPVTVFVSVGSTDIDNVGTFALTASMSGPNAAYTMVPAAVASCDDVSMAIRNPMVVGDDAVTGFVALPFAFNYHRVAVTHWAANTNGLAQLGVMGDTPSDSFDDVMLPSAVAPTGAMAVFWDDLNVGAAPQGFRSQVLGAAPNRRFVIEWANSHLDVANSLRFQAKLFETSNVIEYHYCAMTGPMGTTLHTGTETTIGLQARDRSNGQTFSSNRLNAIGAVSIPVANMIRWTPNP